MKIVADEIIENLKNLLDKGNMIYYALAYDTTEEDEKEELDKMLKKKSIIASKLPNFNASYELWYSEITILQSIEYVIEKVIYSINFTARADLFDSELTAANELFKTGFLRASGAMCGVILEKHLTLVCELHSIIIKKKSPTINDFNEELKIASIIDLPTWRHIQLLGDLRNLCCHDKKVEPTIEQVNDLLIGTQKIIKMIH